MSEPTHQPAPQGPHCTITIEPGNEGVLVACDFGGPLDLADPRLTQMLALTATTAIQDHLATLRQAGAIGVHQGAS